MGLSNAERQRRHRQRLKQKAESGGETPSLAEAWERASVEERRAFCRDYELAGPAEQAGLVSTAIKEGTLRNGSATHEIGTPLWDGAMAIMREDAHQDPSGRVDFGDDHPLLPEDAAAREVYECLSSLNSSELIFRGELAETHIEKHDTGETTPKGNPKRKDVPVCYWYSHPVSNAPHVLWAHAERAKADANRIETSPPPTMEPPDAETSSA